MTTYYIYKIYCNDDNVTDTYIGSSKNIATRKYQHKCKCNNPNSENHNTKVYQIIRANGGWDNWNLVVIEEIKECSKIQAHIREEFHRQELKANMNSVTCFSGAVDYNTKEEYLKQYYEINKNKFLEKEKKWRENNLDKYKDYQKQYKEKNKEQLYKQQSQPYSCECGSIFRQNDKSRHFKSKKHQTYLSTLKEQNL
jgi:hypothetical protein